MPKPFKAVYEPETVANKVRDSSKMEGKKPATDNVERKSSITPTETRPRALTLAAPLGSSSGSITDCASSVTRNPYLAHSNPYAAQLRSSGKSAAAQSTSGPDQSSKSYTPLTRSRSFGSLASQSKIIRSPTKIGNGYLRKVYNSPMRLFQKNPKQRAGTSQRTSAVKKSFSPAKPTASGSAIKPSISSVTIEDSKLIKNTMRSSNAEEVTKAGNNLFDQDCLSEALKLYDRALELSPNNPTYHANRADALSKLCRVGEAVIECEKAIQLDPSLARAHTILADLLVRLGQVYNAGKHYFAVIEPDFKVVRVLERVELHLIECADARRRGKWSAVLKEVNTAMAFGADWSPQLAMCRVEALLKLLRIREAETALQYVPKVEPFPVSFSNTLFFNMKAEAYTSYVTALMELVLGRFEDAVTAVDKALEIDPSNNEVEKLHRIAILITRACGRGNGLYESERCNEAIEAYEQGLKYGPYNATLFSKKADCFFKLGMWEKSIEECNRSLAILPNSIERLRKRAEIYCKLERWAEAIRDYETLGMLQPFENEIADSLIHAQVELDKSFRGAEEFPSLENKESGVEVEEISSVEQLQAALSRQGTSILLYMRASEKKSKEMSVFMDELCKSYPDVHFLKVEIEECPAVGEAEKVKTAPTFKIYLTGIEMKEIVRPSKEALKTLVMHYRL